MVRDVDRKVNGKGRVEVLRRQMVSWKILVCASCQAKEQEKEVPKSRSGRQKRIDKDFQLL